MNNIINPNVPITQLQQSTLGQFCFSISTLPPYYFETNPRYNISSTNTSVCTAEDTELVFLKSLIMLFLEYTKPTVLKKKRLQAKSFNSSKLPHTQARLNLKFLLLLLAFPPTGL